MKRSYSAFLRVYPADYKAAFASEMLYAFEKAAEEHRVLGAVALFRFAFAEFGRVATGAGTEWIATTSLTVPAVRRWWGRRGSARRGRR